jgi:CO dehydrogenase/acetyl-CoA synthase beta subunit
MSVVYSHFWRLLKSEEEDKEEEDKEEEDKEEETLENKMKWILKNLWWQFEKSLKKTKLFFEKSKKRKEQILIRRMQNTLSKHSVVHIIIIHRD